MSDTTLIKEYRGRFGTVVVDYTKDIAVKTTHNFFKRPVSAKPDAPSVRDVFYADRLHDALLYHPSLLPPLRVEINQEAENTLAALKAQSDSGGTPLAQEAGLKITMRACRLRQTRKADYQEPTIVNLAKMYEDSRASPAWIAYVGETILNLADAVAYLRNQGIAHLDITPKNVLVDTQSLDGEVDELFEKTRVYLADRGGNFLTEYCYAVVPDRVLADPTFTGAAQRDARTKVDFTARMYGGKETSAFDDKEISHCEIFMLGSLAATLLTGISFGVNKFVRTFDERQYISKNSGLKKASSLIDVILTTGLDFVDDVYTPYTSIDAFITAFKTALQQHFYVVPRKELPRQTQLLLGTGSIGYVVCTPKRFVQLMYGGQRMLDLNECQALSKIFKNPYSGENIGALSSPTLPLDDIADPIPQTLVRDIFAFQKGAKEKEKTEKATQRTAVFNRKIALETEVKLLETNFNALNNELAEIKKIEESLIRTK
ncbi:hypothetical protein HZC31_05845 [Candidatus Woesearchaeota archaeon]|nr:hypothetical protein [Candidatus Woesearchaeota archaeon]